MIQHCTVFDLFGAYGASTASSVYSDMLHIMMLSVLVKIIAGKFRADFVHRKGCENLYEGMALLILAHFGDYQLSLSNGHGKIKLNPIPKIQPVMIILK